MKLKTDFLNTYSINLGKVLKKPTSFNVIKDYFNDDSYKSFVPYDFEETYDYLLKLKSLLEMITSIINNPHSRTSSEEIIIRSELSRSLSSQCFKDTVKDIKLWRNKDGEMTPEYVHQQSQIDSIVTYENIFISMLIDYVEDDINEIISTINPLIKSIEQIYETKGITFGRHSFINTIDNKGQPIQNECILDKGSNHEVLDLCKRLFKRVKNLKGTEFYRFNHKEKITGAIQVTNILIHDSLYSFCYRFFLDNYFSKNNESNFEKDIQYFNYASSLLLKYSSQYIDSNHMFYMDNNIITFSPFEMNKGMFTINVSKVDNKLALIVKTTFNNNDSLLYTSNKYILFTYKYDDATKARYSKMIDNLNDLYDEVIIVTQNNTVDEYVNIANLSIYSYENSLLIKNFLNSLTMLFKCKDDYYLNVCPICGDRHTAYKNDECVCGNCHAKYLFFKSNDINLLWLKTLRRQK